MSPDQQFYNVLWRKASGETGCTGFVRSTLENVREFVLVMNENYPKTHYWLQAAYGDGDSLHSAWGRQRTNHAIYELPTGLWMVVWDGPPTTQFGIVGAKRHDP